MLRQIAIYLRAMQLYYHSAHNLSKGPTFNQDHETFVDFYTSIEADYDGVIERAMVLEGEAAADLKLQMKDVYNIIKDKPCVGTENKVFFQEGLKCEVELCRLIGEHIKAGCSAGVEQLIGNIADKSDVRQYLIQQRLK